MWQCILREVPEDVLEVYLWHDSCIYGQSILYQVQENVFRGIHVTCLHLYQVHENAYIAHTRIMCMKRQSASYTMCFMYIEHPHSRLCSFILLLVRTWNTFYETHGQSSVYQAPSNTFVCYVRTSNRMKEQRWDLCNVFWCQHAVCRSV